MYNIERKAAIIAMLEQQGEVEVNELAIHFNVSKETVRRDLTELEREGALTRTHGGALSARSKLNSLGEYTVSVRGIQRFNEKNAICRFSAKMIQDEDTIFVDNSSTCLYLMQYLPQGIHLTVITNSIKLLVEASRLNLPFVSYFCLGGTFKSSNMSLYGNTSLRNAQEYYPAKAFVSCAGIRPDGLLTDGSGQEADTKKLMLEHAREIYLLADHTKFSSSGSVYLSHIKRGNNIITDRDTDASRLDPLEKLGANVYVAE